MSSLDLKVLSLSDESEIAALCQAHGIEPAQYAALWQSANSAKAKAYCPYSKFQVGAAILTGDGSVIYGANVENASYPVGTCAERVAIGRALMDGYGRPGEASEKQFKAIAVATNLVITGGQGSEPLKGVASPCGMCRQFIREFSPLNMPIFMFDNDGKSVTLKLEQLLPLSFGPEALLPSGPAA